MDKRLDNKVIVITGTSSGFGKGAARRMSELGGSLVLAARREYLLDDLVYEYERLGGHATAVPADVSLVGDVQNIYDAAIAKFGRIDVWINNAGGAAIGNFTDVPLADHIKVIETDLNGTMYGSYFALQAFERQGFGTLINVASMIGRIAAPYYTSYSAAKHGVIGLTAALRQEMSERKLDNIHICSVLPMAMETPFFEHAANYTGKESVAIPPISNPIKVVETFIDLIFHPKAEVAVGKGGVLFSISDAMAPGLTEAMMAKNTHNAQIKNAPPAEPTPGNLINPTPDGSDVRGRV